MHHTAAAPAVDVAISSSKRWKYGRTKIKDLSNMEQAVRDVRAGRTYVSIAPTGSYHPVFGPIRLDLDGETLYSVYAVGSLDLGTFELLILPLATN